MKLRVQIRYRAHRKVLIISLLIIFASHNLIRIFNKYLFVQLTIENKKRLNFRRHSSEMILNPALIPYSNQIRITRSKKMPRVEILRNQEKKKFLFDRAKNLTMRSPDLRPVTRLRKDPVARER